MKSLPLLLAALLAIPVSAIAAEAIKIDIYLADQLEQSVTLSGPNSTASITGSNMPGTTFELRLIAPEPLIVELKEHSNDGRADATGRAKILAAGNSFAVSEIKGSTFRNPYVLVRRN